MLKAAENRTLVVTGSTNGNNSIGVTIGEQGGIVEVEILGSGPVTVNNPSTVTTNSSSNHSQNINDNNTPTSPSTSQNFTNTTDVVNNGIKNSDTTGPAGNFNNRNGIPAAVDENKNATDQNGTTKPPNSTGNPNKTSSGNRKHWSLGTALENSWDRFWSAVWGSSNENVNGINGDTNLGNSNGDIWGNGWNDGRAGVTSNGNIEINNGNNNNRDSR